MVAITIKQVALEAGVSYLTALRALGGSPGQVRPSTAERVRRAADRLEYRPNAAARALTTQTSPYIGVLYGMGPGCSRRISPAEMMRAYAEFHFELTTELESREYHLLISSGIPHVAGSASNDAGGMPKLLCQRHVGGLVVIGDVWPELHREILRLRLPTVGIYCQAVPQVPTVDLNYRAAARSCTQHLLDLGHRRIAFIPGRWKTWKTEPMQLGYLAALGEAGVKPVAGWDQFRDTTELALSPEREASAAVVYDDYEAVRLIDHLESQGFRVPAHMSIASVQNLGPWNIRQPIVSGCPIPAVAMARRAVQLLMERFAEQTADSGNQLIDAVFSAGNSSKPF